MFKKKLVLYFSAVVIALTGCATELTQEGAAIRLVDNQADYNCRFVGAVTGSNSLGNSTAHDAEGAMNQSRNKAAELGANAIRVINVSTTTEVTAIVGEALKCEF